MDQLALIKNYVVISTNTLQKPYFPDHIPFLYFYNNAVGENNPHRGIPEGFSGSGWAKLGGEKTLDSRAFGGL